MMEVLITLAGSLSVALTTYLTHTYNQMKEDEKELKNQDITAERRQYLNDEIKDDKRILNDAFLGLGIPGGFIAVIVPECRARCGAR